MDRLKNKQFTQCCRMGSLLPPAAFHRKRKKRTVEGAFLLKRHSSICSRESAALPPQSSH